MEEQCSCTGSLEASTWTYSARETEGLARPQSRTKGLRSRRRIDPRVSIVVLVLLNVIAFAAASRWILLGAIAMDTVLLAWCGKPKIALYWLLGYAAMNAICYTCIAAGPTFSPFGACLRPSVFRHSEPRHSCNLRGAALLPSHREGGPLGAGSHGAAQRTVFSCANVSTSR